MFTMVAKPICPNPSCGSDKIMVIKEGLAKCLICGTYLTPATSKKPTRFYRNEVMTRPDEIKDIASIPLEKFSEDETKKTPVIPADMIIFIGRVAEKLAPLTGLDSTGKERALEVQKEIRKELMDVFQGNKDFNKWYDETKTKFGLHHQTFVSMLYESLQGLSSPEAQELQQQYAQTLARMRQA